MLARSEFPGASQFLQPKVNDKNFCSSGITLTYESNADGFTREDLDGGSGQLSSDIPIQYPQQSHGTIESPNSDAGLDKPGVPVILDG